MTKVNSHDTRLEQGLIYLKMNGAKILIESLKREGVEVMFGISGGTIIDIFDVLYDEPEIKFFNPLPQCL